MLIPSDPATRLMLIIVTGLSATLVYLLITRIREKLARRAQNARRPALYMSLTGLIYCAMMFFMGLAAIQDRANLLYGVFGLMIGLLLISGVVSRQVMRGLSVRRTVPDHAIVGRSATLGWEVSNLKKFWPSLSITISELDGTAGFTAPPQAYFLHVPPGATEHATSQVVPTRRGLHALDRYQLRGSFPFGFIHRASTGRQSDVVLAYPALATVDRSLLALCRGEETNGASIRPRKGGSDEFYGVREHRPGDNPRWIHWRRSARTLSSTGVLAAREMTHVAPPRLILLVDTFMPAPRDGDGDLLVRGAAVERTIAMAASLAAAALDQELSVGLVAWSGGWKTVEPGRGKRRRNDLLSLLAQLPPNETHDATALLRQSRRLSGAGATLVLFTPVAQRAPRDAIIARPRAALTRPGNGPLVLSPDAPASAAWFRFDANVDFTRCAPAQAQARRKWWKAGRKAQGR